MTTATVEPPRAAAELSPLSPNAVLHRFTAEAYERLIALGALGPEDKVELLDGYIVDKMPDGRPHARALRRLVHFFARQGSDLWVVQSQSAVRLEGPSLPEPDVALLRPPLDQYDERRPRPADVILLIEVSESSLATDRGDKLRAYARAGVAEYWIVNLAERAVEVHREPEPDAGRYRSVHAARPGATVAPAAFPDAGLPVAELFG